MLCSKQAQPHIHVHACFCVSRVQNAALNHLVQFVHASGVQLRREAWHDVIPQHRRGPGLWQPSVVHPSTGCRQQTACRKVSSSFQDSCPVWLQPSLWLLTQLFVVSDVQNSPAVPYRPEWFLRTYIQQCEPHSPHIAHHLPCISHPTSLTLCLCLAGRTLHGHMTARPRAC